MDKRKNILIIGGDSFVAGNFVEKTGLANNILKISRRNTNYEKEVISLDFSDIKEKHFQWADIVFNCAAIVHSPKASTESYYEVNYKLTEKNALKAKNNGVRLFIQMSTIAVYGNQPHIDKSTVEKPLNPYGKSKLLADNALREMATDDFKVLILRPPMIYGETHAPGNMRKLITLVNTGLPLPLAGINNKKQFLNIDNLVAFLDDAIEKEPTGIKIPADKESISTTELVKLIGKKLNKQPFLFHIPGQIFLIKHFFPAFYQKLYTDLSIHSDLTPFRNKMTSLNEGIEKMVRTGEYT